MDVIDRLNHGMAELKRLGVEIRFEDLQGIAGGLCSVGGRNLLLVDVAMTSSEQLQVFEETISKMKSSAQSAA